MYTWAISEAISIKYAFVIYAMFSPSWKYFFEFFEYFLNFIMYICTTVYGTGYKNTHVFSYTKTHILFLSLCYLCYVLSKFFSRRCISSYFMFAYFYILVFKSIHSWFGFIISALIQLLLYHFIIFYYMR